MIILIHLVLTMFSTWILKLFDSSLKDTNVRIIIDYQKHVLVWKILNDKEFNLKFLYSLQEKMKVYDLIFAVQIFSPLLPKMYLSG